VRASRVRGISSEETSRRRMMRSHRSRGRMKTETELGKKKSDGDATTRRRVKRRKR